MSSSLSVQNFIKDENIQKRISDLLDKRAGQFTTSLLTTINTNTTLAQCRPETVLNAALTAASMNLPINPSLGQAAIVPYKNHGVYEAQFQIQWKGFIQLAQRSGLYKTIGVTEVYEGQLIEEDPLLGYVFDWKKRKSDTVVGYAAFFRLLNGFEKTAYMTHEEVEAHAKRFSTAYQYDLREKKQKSQWSIDFDSMGKKTVIKRLIDQWGPKSTELETAIISDQSVIKDTGRVYVDNLSEDEQEEQKAIDAISNAKDGDELTEIVRELPADIQKKVTTHAQEKFRSFGDVQQDN